MSVGDKAVEILSDIDHLGDGDNYWFVVQKKMTT